MKKTDAPEKVIFICDGKKCGKYSKPLRKFFKEAVRENGLKKEVEIVYMDCTDRCKSAPNICIQPNNTWMGEVEEKDVSSIFSKYIV